MPAPSSEEIRQAIEAWLEAGLDPAAVTKAKAVMDRADLIKVEAARLHESQYRNERLAAISGELVEGGIEIEEGLRRWSDVLDASAEPSGWPILTTLADSVRKSAREVAHQSLIEQAEGHIAPRFEKLEAQAKKASVSLAGITTYDEALAAGAKATAALRRLGELDHERSLLLAAHTTLDDIGVQTGARDLPLGISWTLETVLS